MRHPASHLCARVSLVLLVLVSIASASLASSGRSLGFAERVEAQRAIERVYYSHQTGATKPFEEAVTESLLERKVRTYLRQSEALEKYWSTPVTSAALRAELDRIAAGTRLPGRLREIYSALGNDAFLIQECLARPALVDRLSRSFFARDQRFHADSRAEAGRMHRRLAGGEIDVRSELPGRHVVRVRALAEGEMAATPAARSGEAPDRQLRGLAPAEYRKWRARFGDVGEIGPVTEERDAFVVGVLLEDEPAGALAAIYTFPKRSWHGWWESVERGLNPRRVRAVAQELPAETLLKPLGGTPVEGADGSGAGACVPGDTWDNGILDEVPDARDSAAAVWTGSVVLIWGGYGGSTAFGDGWRYDPLNDSWTRISSLNAPTARGSHTGVWTGTEMIVWGGHDVSDTEVSTGGRYEPVSDTWTPTSTVAAPSGRNTHTATWTGSVMVVWGGYGADGLPNPDTGGRYDPSSDTWTPISLLGAPFPRGDHTAVWTGSEVVVWGGYSYDGDTYFFLDTGGRYDPVSDTWRPTSLAGAPMARAIHSATWTGSVMVVWGGYSDDGSGGAYVDTGGRYDPARDTWTPTSIVGAPSGRSGHSATWTGSRLVIWGGFEYGPPFDSGARYDPDSDTWTSTATLNAPQGRGYHAAVWTGNVIVVWGGTGDGALVASGGRYDPVNDTWTPTFTGTAPSARNLHSAVWTGNLMIVWGGYGSLDLTRTGGRYDPASDTWTPTSTVDAPSAREWNTVTWTGSEMIVWGGWDSDGMSGTGGRYDPLSDTWTPTSMIGAPAPRGFHTAVWTGSKMVVWGGDLWGPATDTGGRYDPVTDNWTPTSLSGAPEIRFLHSAVWTGDSMVVWGGYYYDGSWGYSLNSGGRYDPMSDTWRPVSEVNAPTPRYRSPLIWTGSLVVAWGGTDNNGVLFGSGGRYDPLEDTWLPISEANAPSARLGHSASWTGNVMVVWGGKSIGSPYSSYVSLDTGGRYDPVGDTWAPTSTDNAPTSRSDHSAVWTGNMMIVWGGGEYTSTGGRYFPGGASDADGDGVRGCEGDCNDDDPEVFPGAAESCNGRDDNCDGQVDEGLPAGGVSCDTGQAGVCAAGTTTCNSGMMECRPAVRPSREICDGVDNDCNGAVDDDLGTTTCGIGECRRTVSNCVGGAPHACVPGTASPEIPDGLDNDCDGSTDELFPDTDGDGSADGVDCAPNDPSASAEPGAIGEVTMADVTGGYRLGWPDQALTHGSGTRYDVFSGTLSPGHPAGDFAGGLCLMDDHAGAHVDYTGPWPAAGQAIYFMIRAQNGCPRGTGSFGSPDRDAGAGRSASPCS